VFPPTPQAGAAPTHPTPPPVGSGVTISIASDSPVGSAVAKGAYDRVIAKINVGAGQAVTVNSIAVHRDGVAVDADISEVKIYDGNTQLGSTQALNTITHKAVFTGLNWAIAAGQTKVLTIKANISATATPGDLVNMGIKANSDIVLATSGIVISGAPVYGGNVTIAGASVGVLDVDSLESSSTGDVISGSTDQQVGGFKFAANATEGFDVTVASRHVGVGRAQGWTTTRVINHWVANTLFAKYIAGIREVYDKNGAYRAIRVKGVLDKTKLAKIDIHGFGFRLFISNATFPDAADSVLVTAVFAATWG